MIGVQIEDVKVRSLFYADDGLLQGKSVQEAELAGNKRGEEISKKTRT